MKTELEKLKERIAELEKRQLSCNHEWLEPEYDPEEREIKRDEFVYLGSDSYYTEVGTGNYEKIDRWSRVCKKCQKKEYTYEEEVIPVKTITRPKFGK